MSKKKKPRNAKSGNNVMSNFAVKDIQPQTEAQEKAFAAFDSGKHLVLHGVAGTGKTFIALYLALDEKINGDGGHDKIVVIRSAVPSRDMGYLPGSKAEKAAAYETPYVGICNELFSRGDGYQVLLSKDWIEFTTTSYLRGMTFDNKILIVDEIQNMTWQELDTIMTRIGKNCIVIFAGDYKQTDLDGNREKSGLRDFMKVLARIPEFEKVEFGTDDIVRSELVKKYIIAKTELDL